MDAVKAGTGDRLRFGVTGITGGLGRRLGEMLLEYGFPVTALVRNSSHREEGSGRIRIIHGDVCDPASLSPFVRDIDICVHLAAQVGYATKKQYTDINISGTDNVCRAILTHNPDCRLIHCSTISTLKVHPLITWMSSPYAVSKYYAENKVRAHIKNDNLKATIIYPGLIYGGYDRSFVPQIIAAIEKGTIKLIKGGEHLAPLIHADELCELFIAAALHENSIGKRYISVQGIDLGIHEIIKTIASEKKLDLPDKISRKAPLFMLAVVIELWYRFFKNGGKPFINRTAVDVLSINIHNYKKHYDDPWHDLGWEQDPSKEFFLKKMKEILQTSSGRS